MGSTSNSKTYKQTTIKIKQDYQRPKAPDMRQSQKSDGVEYCFRGYFLLR